MADDEASEPDLGTPDDILEEAREAYKLCEEAEADNRREALDDLRFARLDEQWPSEIRKQRQDEGRPCLTTNLLKPIIRQVVNDARQNRPQIKVHPADSAADLHTAKLLNGLIRNIEATSRADQAYDTGVDYSVTMGFGYWKVNTYYAQDDSFDLDLCIERIANPFSIFGDPHSTAADSSDWNLAFEVEHIPQDVFERKYKGAERVDWRMGDYANLKPPWRENEEVLLARYWTREETKRTILLLSNQDVVDAEVFQTHADEFAALGVSVVGERVVPSHKVRHRLLTGAEVLEDNEWAGKYIPIVPVYGDDINVDGKRYLSSLIRSAKDPQRKYNYWDTTATELTALAPKVPFIGPKGAFVTDAAKWGSANTTSHAFIEYDGQVAPTRQPLDVGTAAGSLQQALAAANDIKATTGIYDAMQGAPSNETSGKAILNRKKEGDVSTFHFIDNLSRAIEHTGRILIDLIPHVYTGQRMIRVLGADGQRLPPVPLGQPVQVMDNKGKPEIDKDTGQAIIHTYDLTLGKYDLTVEAGPSYTTQREETADTIVAVIQAAPETASILVPKLMRNLDVPDADEIADALDGKDPRTQALQQQVTQLQQQLQSVLQQVDQGKRQYDQALADASAAANDAQVRLDQEKLRTDVERQKMDVARFEAETDRLKALKDIAQIVGAPLVAEIVAQTMNTPDIAPGQAQIIPPSPFGQAA